MKTLYIEAFQKSDLIELDNSEIKKLPKRLFLAYSIQYKKLAESIKKQLIENGIKLERFQQVLGCSVVKTNLPILLVSTGKFHARNLFLQTPILYVLENDKIIQIPKKDIENQRIMRKTALMKFLSSENIGILVSTKLGQENLDKAIKLKADIEKKGKNAFIFLSNNIDISQFENFNIGSWVNTACPGLCFDNSSIINMNEVPK